MTIRSDELNFTNSIASGVKADSEAAGRTIAQSLACKVQSDTLGLIMLGDGLTLNFEPFAADLKSELQLDRHLPLFGGTSADNLQFKQTYQYCDDEITSDGVACILLSGSARLAWSVNHGCLPIGGERKVTCCSGNVIYEIDGMLVLDVLKEYLIGDEIDNWSKTVLSLCIAFEAPETIKGYDD